MSEADLRPTIRLGISSCLLGEEVRFDGGHKRDAFLTGTVGELVEWVPVCPEVELGLGTPREPVRLVRSSGEVLLLGTRTSRDHTDAMRDYARRRATELRAERLDGYVLKRSSPSCGLYRVKTYDEAGMPAPGGRGLFAEALVETLPLLPVEEEGRLQDPGLRENFFERVFAHHRWQRLVEEPSAAALVDFHATHKYVLLAHSPGSFRELGRLVARAGTEDLGTLLETYGAEFMRALSVRSTRARHVNVLQHLLGFLKRTIDDRDRAELVALIEDYRNGLVPLVVPVTLLRHHLLRTDSHEWARRQVYLSPYPRELMLRNHV